MTTALASSPSKSRKAVPTRYETDESKYVGPHRWHPWWARIVRRLWRKRAYTQWLTRACSRIEIFGAEHLEGIDGPCVRREPPEPHRHVAGTCCVTRSDSLANLLRRSAGPLVRQRQKELTLKPWYQSLALGNFPILRGGGAGCTHAHWLLQHGQHVFLFPEGTRDE